MGNSPIIIGLTGKMRSGKDTVASYLSEYNFTRVAYGDALKQHYHNIFGDSSEGKDRKGYQQFGQLMRETDPDIWVKHADVKVRIDTALNYNVVITDVRQPNEVEHIRKLGGYLIRVNAGNEARITRMIDLGDNYTVHDLVHETETYIDKFAVDYEIQNNGNLDALVRKVRIMLQRVENGTIKKGSKVWAD